jgi:cytochrome P450 family 104
MVNAKHPIPKSQIIANVKIAIGGGINEPRDALLSDPLRPVHQSGSA